MNTSICSFVLLLEAWLYWIRSRVSSSIARIYSSFLLLVGVVRSACCFLLGHDVEWTDVFCFDEESEDVTVVVRVASSLFNKRVQGLLVVQQYGSSSLFRLLIDGHEVIPRADGGGNMQGDRLMGALLLPDGIKWTVNTKKAKSGNASTIRGRCTYVSFVDNLTGMTSLQVTTIHDTRNNGNGKAVGALFEEKMKAAAELVNSRPNTNNMVTI
ncbi:unknown protein [Seminavis robusta]|uniref:Uncharacterized protein n=1 Tax=Seminavis robusta TaxID=568900 RepID=A0A9N8DN80_9STRA|nr:unknown protein [Seminavis robusta]|eukprot:Sro220_g090780.1 n/a (213) ;mRNA; r:67626-68264